MFTIKDRGLLLCRETSYLFHILHEQISIWEHPAHETYNLKKEKMLQILCWTHVLALCHRLDEVVLQIAFILKTKKKAFIIMNTTCGPNIYQGISLLHI